MDFTVTFSVILCCSSEMQKSMCIKKRSEVHKEHDLRYILDTVHKEIKAMRKSLHLVFSCFFFWLSHRFIFPFLIVPGFSDLGL